MPGPAVSGAAPGLLLDSQEADKPLPDLILKRHRKYRQGVQDQLRTIIRRGHEIVDDMDPQALDRRPDENTWSVAECLSHLNETARLYLPELAKTIEEAREQGRLAHPGSGERTLIGRLIVWTQEPPVRLLRVRTFEAIEPRRDEGPGDVVDAFEALHEELIVRMNEAADLDRKRIKMRSVLDRRLRLSLGDWFHYLAAHARRHLWQAERVKERLDASR